MRAPNSPRPPGRRRCPHTSILARDVGVAKRGHEAAQFQGFNRPDLNSFHLKVVNKSLSPGTGICNTFRVLVECLSAGKNLLYCNVNWPNRFALGTNGAEPAGSVLILARWHQARSNRLSANRRSRGGDTAEYANATPAPRMVTRQTATDFTQPPKGRGAGTGGRTRTDTPCGSRF